MRCFKQMRFTYTTKITEDTLHTHFPCCYSLRTGLQDANSSGVSRIFWDHVKAYMELQFNGLFVELWWLLSEVKDLPNAFSLDRPASDMMDPELWPSVIACPRPSGCVRMAHHPLHMARVCGPRSSPPIRNIYICRARLCAPPNCIRVTALPTWCTNHARPTGHMGSLDVLASLSSVFTPVRGPRR